MTHQATPNDQGVLVFGELPDGYYNLTQDEGVWCRAAAERVDSRGRVIVRDGRNTDVFIYECGQVKELPDTGIGPGQVAGSPIANASSLLAAMAIPAFGATLWHLRRTRPEPARVRIYKREGRVEPAGEPSRMRFW